MKPIRSASTKIASIRPASQTTLFPGLSGGNVGGAPEVAVVVTPPLLSGEGEDSGCGATAALVTFPPIPLCMKKQSANSHARL